MLRFNLLAYSGPTSRLASLSTLPPLPAWVLKMTIFGPSCTTSKPLSAATLIDRPLASDMVSDSRA